VGDFDRVILSARGLREGVLFDRLMRETPDNHPLLAAAEVFGRPQPQPGVRAYCRALGEWMARVFDPMPSVFADPARERLLRAAAARMSEYGATLHPDQRQENTFGLVLLGHHAGISNEERVFLAACAHYRHDRAAPKNNRIYDQFLTDDQKKRTQQVGAVMRLGAELSGRTKSVLEAFALRWSGASLELASETAPDWMISEPVERRLRTVGELLGATRTHISLTSPPR
jgi:exopolyphosphatase/guanosine-5'-triphosphate,3'-diphosphate pyrophosphatase